MIAGSPAKHTTVPDTLRFRPVSKEAQQQFEEATAQIQRARYTTTLHISQLAELREVPETIGLCGKLISLSIDNNFSLTQLPDGLGELYNLEQANFSYNALQRFPDSICTLKLLTVLNLSNNYIRAVSPTIGRLVSLTQLVLDNNYLQALPPSITLLRRLKKFSISNNPLVTPSTEAVEASPSAIAKEMPPAEANPQYKDVECSVCMGNFVEGEPLNVYTYIDFAGIKGLPLRHAVCSARCKEILKETQESEVVDYSILRYDVEEE